MILFSTVVLSVPKTLVQETGDSGESMVSDQSSSHQRRINRNFRFIKTPPRLQTPSPPIVPSSFSPSPKMPAEDSAFGVHQRRLLLLRHSDDGNGDGITIPSRIASPSRGILEEDLDENSCKKWDPLCEDRSAAKESPGEEGIYQCGLNGCGDELALMKPGFFVDEDDDGLPCIEGGGSQ